MVLIRLAHIAPMPTPAEIIKSLTEEPMDAPAAQTPTAILSSEAPRTESELVPAQVAPTQIPQTETSPVETDIPSQLANEKNSPAGTVFSSLQDIAISLNEAGEKILAARLRQHLRPVSLADGKLEVQIDGDVKHENFLGDLARFMSQKSGQPWLVSQASQGGGQTLAELDSQADEQKKKAAAEHPIVAAILDKFDSAEITAVRPQNAEDEIHSDDEVKNA
jgi:DNA polymerase-3 subunit gamma/tau